MIRLNWLTLLSLLAAVMSVHRAWAAGDADHGRKVTEKSCVLCHAVAGARNPRAPSFQSIVRRQGRNDAYLRGFLEDDHFPMVMQSLVERDKEDVLEYFRSLRRRR
jgi:cytochrome c2